MKLLIDENINVAVLDPLRATFGEEVFATVREQNWVGLHDDELFLAMKDHRFDVLITRDRNQLADRDERAALRAHGLHWVGVPSPQFGGVKGMALETACLVAGLPYVLEDLAQCLAPTAFHMRGVTSEHNQRVKVETL